MSRRDVAWYLSITAGEVTGVPVLLLAGRLSSDTSSDLSRAIQSAAAQPVPGIVVDLTDVDYVSSAGLRALHAGAGQLHAGKQMLVLCGLRPNVALSFSLAGKIPHLEIESTRDEAIARVLGQGGA